MLTSKIATFLAFLLVGLSFLRTTTASRTIQDLSWAPENRPLVTKSFVPSIHKSLSATPVKSNSMLLFTSMSSKKTVPRTVFCCTLPSFDSRLKSFAFSPPCSRGAENRTRSVFLRTSTASHAVGAFLCRGAENRTRSVWSQTRCTTGILRPDTKNLPKPERTT